MAFENNLSIKKINVEVNSSPTSAKAVSDTSSNVPIVRKVQLTEVQEHQMLMLGLDPTNEMDVNSYLMMSPDAVKNKLDELLTKPIPQQNEIERVANHEHQHVEHEHNCVIGFEYDKWENADPQGKLFDFMTQGAKQKFTEEAWNKLSEREKNIERDKFLNEEFSVHNSEWESADETKKLTIISEFLNDNMLAEYLKMTRPELFAFKTTSPDEYAKKQEIFFNNNKKIDLVAEKEKAKYEFVQQRENAEKNYNDTLSEFLKNHNITKEEFLENKELILKFNAQYTDTVENNSKSKFDKYQAKNEQYKQLLTTFLSEKGQKEEDYFKNLQLQLDYYEYYKKEYGENAIPPSQKENIAAIEQLKEINGGSLEKIGAGDKSFLDIISSEDNFEFDEYGNIALDDEHFWKKSDAVFRRYLNLSDDATADEVMKALADSDLDAYSISLALKTMTSIKNPNRISMQEAHKTGQIHTAYLLSASQDIKDENDQTYVAEVLLPEQHQKVQKRGGDLSGIYKLTGEMAKNYTKENAALLSETSAELNDRNMVMATNQGIAQREDALEVLNIANQLINNSETISDEMKQFYAQNTVESLLTDEQRNAQIENLRTYDNEYFNTGIKDGLNNIANQTSSSSEGSTSQSGLYGDYSYNNPLQTSQITLSEPAQVVKNNIDDMLSGNLSQEALIEEFNKLPRDEQSKLLEAYVAEKGDKINVKLCDAFPELVPVLVENGKGLDIVARCSMPTGNKAIKMLPDKEMKILAMNNPHRLSQATYQSLVEEGVVKVGHPNPYQAKA